MIHIKWTRLIVVLVVVLVMMALLMVFLTSSGTVMFQLRGGHPDNWPGYRDCLPAEKVGGLSLLSECTLD